MKIKISIALIATMVFCVGMYYFLSGNFVCKIPAKSTSTIVGTWKIDTAYNNADATKLSVMIPFLYKDTATFKFNTDSTLQTILPKETDIQNYYVNNDSLFIKQDSVYTSMLVKFVNDSCINITGKDSTTIVLSKILK